MGGGWGVEMVAFTFSEMWTSNRGDATAWGGVGCGGGVGMRLVLGTE